MSVQPRLRVIRRGLVVDHERPVRSLEQQEFAGHLRVEPAEEFGLRRLALLFAGIERRLETVHHPAHAEEQRVFPAHLVVHPDFAKAAFAPRRECRAVHAGVARGMHRRFERSHLHRIGTGGALEQLLDKRGTFEPPVSEKFRIVGAQDGDLVALHLREEFGDSRLAIRDKEPRVVFGQAERVPRAVNQLVLATRNAVVLEARLDGGRARHEIVSQVVGFPLVGDILEELAVLGVPRVARLAAPYFHGTALFAAHAIKPRRGLYWRKYSVFGRGLCQKHAMGLEEKVFKPEFGQNGIEPHEIPAFGEPKPAGPEPEGLLERLHGHAELQANRRHVGLVRASSAKAQSRNCRCVPSSR